MSNSQHTVPAEVNQSGYSDYDVAYLDALPADQFVSAMNAVLASRLG